MIYSKSEAFLIAAVYGMCYLVAFPDPISTANDVTANDVAKSTVLHEIEECLVDDEWVCEYFDQRDTWVSDPNSKISAAGDASGIRDGYVPFWESQMVNRLPLVEGEYRVVFSDVREDQDYPFSFTPILDVLRENTSVEAVVGKCEDYPTWSCILLEDFNPPESMKEETAAYCLFFINSVRKVGFEVEPNGFYYFHEFGHALGLSHKFSPGGVMGYKDFEDHFNWEEISTIQEAYPRKVVEIEVD